ncbi:UDP-2,3-diacylglucosamine diphosphatase [Geotalea sp. SG265]|uniref:UDP-2,3-diacylglucosamine diphosphatase n=1 Tax=Geotalea sp. SG265 TaxID=2922867 RepID=UPI001FAF197E|nr:UDP-2,3-diacylglucosamine diphosphatase [Geotalea sp. SG265]
MRRIFIADAHLRNAADANYRMLLRFLATLEGNTGTLYILGDLFEFWIGYRRPAFPHYQPVLEQLLKLARSGTRIVYFEGNHDFHMGPYFTETLRASVHPGPAVIDMDGKRVFLCHGDQINRRDYRYRLLRGVLHCRLTRMIVPLVPVGLASSIADRMSRQSSSKHDRRRLTWDYPALIRQFAHDQFELGCDTVICGHFHLPFLEKSGSGDGQTLLCLGDWISQYSYGEWLDGRLTLKTFS